MAVVAFTRLAQPNDGHGVLVFQWANMANGDTGEPVIHPDYADVSVQLVGTLSTGGECTMQGANHPAAPTWQTLEDAHENALAMVTLKIEQILQSPYQIRPSVTGGDGSTSLTVLIKMRRVR